MHRLPAVFLTALPIPASSVLQLRKQLLVRHIAGFHVDRLTSILKRLRSIMQASLSERVEIIPASIALAVRYAAQRIERLSIVTGVDIILRSAHFNDVIIRLLLVLALLTIAITAKEISKRIALILTLTVSAVPAITARALLLRSVITAARARTAALTPVHNLFVGLLNLHEFLFGLRGVRLAYVGVRMIDLAQLAVCLFYLVVTRRRRNAQYLIRIRHDSFFAFLRSVACSNLSHMPE